jgi:hypothetical protein
MVDKNIKLHETQSPLLFGNIEDKYKITERKVTSYKSHQKDLFE